MITFEMRGEHPLSLVSVRRILEIVPGRNLCAFVLTEGARLNIEVWTRKGKRYSGRALLRPSGGGAFFEATTSPVPPGRYDLLAGHWRDGARKLENVELVPGDQRSFRIDLAPLTPLFLEVKGAAARPEVTIVNSAGFDHAGFGRFPRFFLEPGIYQVTVSEGARIASSPVRIGDSAQRLTLELP